MGCDSPVMNARDRDALDDILAAIRCVKGFPIPDRETFMASGVLQDVVVRNLEIIGKATKRQGSSVMLRPLSMDRFGSTVAV